MKTLLAWFVLLMAASPLRGQIVVPPEMPPHQPIVARLANPIPDGAQVQGGWTSATAAYLPVPNGCHVWAPPGSHQIAYRGIWVKTRPITIDGQTVQVLEGFGFIDESAQFKVTGGGPDPGPNPPDPPVPGGKWLLMMVYEANRLDDYPEPQRRLLTSRATWEYIASKGHRLLRVVEQSALDQPVTGDWATWFNAAKGKAVPGMLMVPEGGGVGKYVSLPPNVDELMKLLEAK